MAILADCRPGRRCKDWRQCPACARIRQCQIANVAEEGAKSSPVVTYAVARVHAPERIEKDRERFMARLATISEGGIWSIETGQISAGLHVNIIAGTIDPVAAADLAKYWPAGSPVDIWAAQIPRADVRNVAAYSAKRSGFPDEKEYSGRLYGSWGAWKRPLAAMVENPRVSRVAAGAALETMLAAAGVPDQIPPPVFEAGPFRGKETAEERAARRERNAQAQAQHMQAQALADRHAQQREHLRRVLAAHAGELQLHGFVYVPGYGVASLAQARELGAIPK